ncbi:MAG: indole-3-glycerol phosphate synthase TrpC [Methanomassiliicoccaceae archaeon]|jgi:indole-3-glycerol phosphate synthase|nr:indole-3-glycerol phosphate synthase TrpC [Methanomassiliicoccaceae archaeon]
MDILNDIVLRTRERVREKSDIIPMEKIKKMAERSDVLNGFPFEDALTGNDIGFICEIKRSSPSAGLISDNFDHLRIAEEYHAAGAAAISVITEPYYFQGDDLYLMGVSSALPIPVLRKDFIVDRYMIYEAKLLGASAVLLICSILDKDTLAEYIGIAHRIGLSALVEVHNEEEVYAAIEAGARIIGVNNRDLRTLEIDLSISERLRPLVPPNIIFVAESGMRTPDDVERMRRIGANAILVGETLMRSSDKTKGLKVLRGGSVGEN